MNTKKLLEMARKWQRRAALKRKRITFGRLSTSRPAAERGCFVVYTADKRRFAFPLSYLNNSIFQELLRMSEDEFGLRSDGPITLPCDSAFVEYLVPLIRQSLDKDTERALLMSISRDRCSLHSSLRQEQSSHQLLVC